jgi:hypothetical protein
VWRGSPELGLHGEHKGHEILPGSAVRKRNTLRHVLGDRCSLHIGNWIVLEGILLPLI